MKKDNLNSSELIRRYLDGTCTEEEKQMMEDWYETLPEGRLHVSEQIIEHDLDLVIARLRKERTKNSQRFLWKKIAAAVVLLLLSLAVYQYYRFINATDPLKLVSTDVDPAKDKATLTLADGTIVDLDSAAIGLLTQQYGTDINKTESGVISYHIDEAKTQLDIAATNTITTPRGGYYKVILPDSSCVWVNAASSLRFPTRFAEDERRVELAGEAYFEVAKNSKKPFIVKSGQQQILVLGTEFNARSYNGEPTVTTLISGKVKVNYNSVNKILQPGQQAISSIKGMELKTVDIEDFVGWKNNVFIFHNTSLKTIMKEIDRWFDVETDISSLPDETFYAEIPRNIKLSEALKMLEGTSDIRFKIEGRRIMIK